jgi:hypothetical protein
LANNSNQAKLSPYETKPYKKLKIDIDEKSRNTVNKVKYPLTSTVNKNSKYEQQIRDEIAVFSAAIMAPYLSASAPRYKELD